jgi:hypothetical protein
VKPVGSVCEKDSECGGDEEGWGVCAHWKTQGPNGGVDWSRCVVGVFEPRAGDACGFRGGSTPLQIGGPPASQRVSDAPLRKGRGRWTRSLSSCGPGTYCGRDSACQPAPGLGAQCDDAPYHARSDWCPIPCAEGLVCWEHKCGVKRAPAA